MEAVKNELGERQVAAQEGISKAVSGAFDEMKAAQARELAALERSERRWQEQLRAWERSAVASERWASALERIAAAVEKES